MTITDLELEGVKLLEPRYFEDNRGFFTESYSHRTLAQNGIYNVFTQDNFSFSAKKGTLRGIHYQNYPYAQTKIVRCLKGAILDVAVDLRKSSPTYKKYISVTLTPENRKQLLIPKGFGHAFVTLEDNTEVFYKVDDYYEYESDGAIFWKDPEINVDWGIDNPILSEKDIKAPMLADSPINF